MISRYALYETTLLEKRFDLSTGLPKGVKPRYNVGPTTLEPVIVNRDGHRVVELMQWGLVANGSRDTNSVFRYKTYNVPSEKILSKHSWEIAVRQSRCLVPVNGFYMFSNSNTDKRAYYVRPKDGSLLALAGIHSVWQNPQGATQQTYSIITTETTQDLPPVGDRMPIIIAQSEEAHWLDADVTDANSLYGMFRSYDTAQLQYHAVSTNIYAKKLDSPQLIEPLHA